MSVDWSKPIMAIHEDGRAVAMKAKGERSCFGSVLTVHTAGPETNNSWNVDGSDTVAKSGWRIRNVAQQIPTPDVVGPLDAGMRTSIEGALEHVRGKGFHGLVHNLERLAAWLDGHPARDDGLRSYYPEFEARVKRMTEADARDWVAINSPGAKADGLLAFLAKHDALLPEPVDALEKCIADAMCGNNVQAFEIASAIRHDRAALRALAAGDQ